MTTSVPVQSRKRLLAAAWFAVFGFLAASLFFLPSTSEELRQKILTGYAADYVVLNAAERPQAAQALEAQEDLKPVLEEDGWIVYRVNR